MGNVFASVGMSLDARIAGPDRGPANPLGDRGVQIHAWMYRTRAFRENLKLAEGGDIGADDDIVNATTRRAGATIMGRRMFDEGERNWPEEAPFHTPVFVLTHGVRAPCERPGGTTFFFVNDGIESALRQAREAAAERDVRVAGGAATIGHFLNAGLVDELSIQIAPMIMGDGLSLFEGVDWRKVSLQVVRATHSPFVTHVDYRVRHAEQRT